MPRTYNEALIKCPFYKGIAQKSISCEGITDDCITKLLFVSDRPKEMHRVIFCENQYMKCEIYRMLDKKYDN